VHGCRVKWILLADDLGAVGQSTVVKLVSPLGQKPGLLQKLLNIEVLQNRAANYPLKSDCGQSAIAIKYDI